MFTLNGIGNSTRLPATMSWFTTQMLFTGIRVYLHETLAKYAKDRNAEMAQLRLDTADRELEHLIAFLNTYPGYDEDEWAEDAVSLHHDILNGNLLIRDDPLEPLEPFDAAKYGLDDV